MPLQPVFDKTRRNDGICQRYIEEKAFMRSTVLKNEEVMPMDPNRFPKSRIRLSNDNCFSGFGKRQAPLKALQRPVKNAKKPPTSAAKRQGSFLRPKIFIIRLKSAPEMPQSKPPRRLLPECKAQAPLPRPHSFHRLSSIR